eukprot:gene8843-9580_t
MSRPVENHLKTGGENLEFANKIEVTNQINPQCLEVFEQLKLRRKHRFLIFKLGTEEIEVDVVGARNQTYEQFKSQLPYSDCRYCIYDQDYKTADGRPASKLWFISWFPKSSTVHVKMAYTSAKGKFREAILGVFDTQVSSLEELDANLGLGSAEDDEDDKDFDF